MTTPAMRALKKTYSDALISLLVGRTSKMAVKRNPYIDEMIEADDYIFYKGRLLQKMAYLLSLILKIRQKRYDVVFVLHRDWRFNLFAFLCGIPERIGFDRDGEGIFLTKRVMIEDIRHHIDHYLEVVKAFGVKDDGRDMDFSIDYEAEKTIEKIFRMADLKEDDIKLGIVAGGASNVKEEMAIRRWPLTYYVELIRMAVADGYEIILLGDHSDEFVSRDILKNVSRSIVDLIGKTTLEETSAVMKRCNIIITHDSGPMHLASSVGVPVISIFGPTDPREKYPLSPGSYYFWKVEDVGCAPCYKEGKFPDCKLPVCMKAITAEQVYQKVKDIVRKVVN